MTPTDIREARVKLGLTPPQMAVMLGYSERGASERISEIENGVRKPDRSKVLLLEAYLDGYRPASWPA